MPVLFDTRSAATSVIVPNAAGTVVHRQSQSTMARGVAMQGQARLRRQSWFGLKAGVKKAMASPLARPALAVAAKVRPNDYWRLPAPSSVTQVEARMSGVNFTMLAPARCVVAKELHWGKGQRPVPADQRALDIFAACARHADVVLDIGAYTGLFSLLSARVAPSARVYAFEMVPQVYAALQANVEANDLGSQITCVPTAVGKSGSVFVPMATGRSALPDFLSVSAQDDGASLAVPSMTLDEWAAQAGVRGRARLVIKIDVEGAEADVLSNADAVLEGRPDILCEVLPDATSRDLITQVLGPLGYSFYAVRDDALVRRADLHADTECRDWLFSAKTPKDLQSLGIQDVREA